MHHCVQRVWNTKVRQAADARLKSAVNGPPCVVSLLETCQLRQGDGGGQFVEAHGTVRRVGRPPLDHVF